MQLPGYLASTTLVAIATAMVTGASPNNQDVLIGPQLDENPVEGSKCNDNGDCAVNSSLYCSVKQHNTCQLRSAEGEPCEVTDACFQGECRGGICGGKVQGAPCSRESECEKSLTCRPENGNRFECNVPARHGDGGSVCRKDGDCGFPFFCVLDNGGLLKYCGINPNCVGYFKPCSVDKDCCRMRCVKEYNSVGPRKFCRYGDD